jgi:hypothetical protein
MNTRQFITIANSMSNATKQVLIIKVKAVYKINKIIIQKQKRDKFQNVRKIGKQKRRKVGEKINQHLKKKKENQKINK